MSIYTRKTDRILMLTDGEKAALLGATHGICNVQAVHNRIWERMEGWRTQCYNQQIEVNFGGEVYEAIEILEGLGAR